MARPQGHRLNRAAFLDFQRLTNTSTTQIEARTGIPASTLRGLQAGKRGASVKAAVALAEALDLNPETLFPSLAPAEVPA